MNTGSTALRLRAVTRDFVGPPFAHALRHVDLDIESGEFVAIMGRSGAGKSTLLNVIGLLDEFTSGNYAVDGVQAETLSPRQRDALRSRVFGFVFQGSNVLAYESVARNAALGLTIAGTARAEKESRVESVLNQVGLRGKADALARTLSGGERQRLAIARAIATEPRIVLADEPTGNLDSVNTEVVMRLFQEMNARGTTVVIITHDPEVARFADRTVVLEDGVLELVDRSRSHTEIARPEPVRSTRPAKLKGSPFTRAAEALTALASRPSRTVALIVAFALGAGGLVAATGLSASASEQVAVRLQASALDEMYVFNPAGTAAATLLETKERVSQLPHVESVGTRIDLSAVDARTSRFAPKTVLGQPTFTGLTLGVDEEYLELMDAHVAPEPAAALFSGQGDAVAIVGASAAEELGISETSSGSQVWVAGRPYDVVGVVTESGRDSVLDSAVIVPASRLPSEPSTFVVRTETGFPAALAEAIPLAVDPSQPGAVKVSTVGDLRSLRMGVAGDLGALVAGVSVIMLLLAVMTGAAVMFLTVQARTPEVALRRALGLSKSGVVTLFLFEGGILGVAGGLAGVAGGLVAVVAVAALNGWSAVLPLATIAIGLGAGAAGGLLSSLIPAIKAAGIQPAEAIR